MEKEEKIRVVVRARPYTRIAERKGNQATNSTGNSFGDQECVVANPENLREVLICTDAARTRAATFRCETFLSPTTTQESVFDQIRAKELVGAALEGFPVTIFAYGQTGAGKSFTIFGQENTAERRQTTHSQDGLLPRIAQELMHSIAERKGKVEYTLRVTCVEIYNEQVRDVFDPRKETLAVRSSKTHGFFLENATVVECVSAREIVQVVKAAATHRAKSSHLLNEHSNRSHCLVTIYIDAMPVNPESQDSPVQGKRYGKITVVDLAGSERVTDSGAVGAQLRETCHINRSLHCLSQVIQAMNAAKSSKVGTRKFIPFRDSKLTMLLVDSLGGNSKTLMLACVNSAPQFATESIRTLEFAMGVAKIKNRPTALLNPHEKLINDLKEQIRLLKEENMMLRARTPGYFTEHPEHEMGFATANSCLADDYIKRRSGERRYPSTTGNKGKCLDFPDRSTLPRSEQTARRKNAQQKLQTLHRKPQLRRTKSPKTNKKISLKRMPASFSDKRSLPPVDNRLPLHHSLQNVNPRDEAFISNQATNLVHPRTASPPPTYDDLFGIETVPIPHPSLLNKHSSPQLHAKRPAQGQALPNNNKVASNTISPEDQLQQLLQQMIPQPKSLPPFAPEMSNNRPKVQPKPIKPSTTLANSRYLKSNNSNRDSNEWDDQRAQDLFMQLCQL